MIQTRHGSRLLSSRFSAVAGQRAAGLARAAGQAGRFALDLLLAPQCPLCAAAVSGAHLLCADCFRGITLLSAPLCRCCGVPMTVSAPDPLLCVACAADPPAFGVARAALRYDAAARRLLLPFKHGGRTDLAPLLATQMTRAGVALLARADVLVPVPLHRQRLVARGYNQAALLARLIARRAARAMLVDALRRSRATNPLGGLDAQARVAALEGAFAANPARHALLAGKQVLLIDDVLTSGATANACARVLLAAGAAGVDVLAAARVPDPRQAEAVAA